MSDRSAVFTEPLAAAFEVLEQVDIKPSHRVAVLGDGKLGLLVAMVLRRTACKLVCVGKRHERLGILSKLGIETMEASAARNIEWEYDVVVDATGSASGMQDAARMVKPRGTIVMKTTVADQRAIDLNALVINEITVTGSRCGPFPKAIEALKKGEVDPEPLISCIMNLDGGAAILENAKRKDVIKALISIQ
ncbi:MAG: zinc-binding dehydrogenase [Nitrospinae bacterium]|nr:zinc-binding dehydrogenase [Nitrospinota bacterium]